MRFLGTLGTRIIFQIGVMTPTALTHLDSAAFGKMGGGGEKCDLTCFHFAANLWKECSVIFFVFHEVSCFLQNTKKVSTTFSA